MNQVGYVTGFFDGLILEQRIFDASLLNVAPPKFNQQFVEFASNVEIQANTQMERLFTRVTVSQLRDGLNNFYSDVRNRSVLAFNAVFVVANAIAGAPMERVENLAETYRVSDAK
jgi:homoserine trans-succinylase